MPGGANNPLCDLDRLQIDRSVAPSQDTNGGYDEGQKRIQRLLKDRLGGYGDRRTNLELVGTSELSAYLHLGQISVQQLAWEVDQYQSDGTTGRDISILIEKKNLPLKKVAGSF